MPVKTKKKALKTFKFWFKVLKESVLMDDPEHRQEYREAIKVFKNTCKKKGA
jgi:hypothetical protein